ncbi:MAG: GGDEF domain-containing protein [Magnetococcales bacterium]|nr:GGDEF domain-containing protein [Magnetococcales bacterium]
MISKEEPRSLFQKEESLIAQCEQTLDDSDASRDALHDGFSALLVGYRKLFRQSKKMVRLSDRQQAELRELNDLKDKYLKEVEALSVTDGLTGIPNRRRFDQFLEFEWRRAHRNATSIAVILMDIDFFKPYNDNYGHAAGDECLVKVAQKLAHTARRTADLVARYGGEEFVCVLPEADLTHASMVAEMMRSAIEGLALPHGHSHVTNVVTMSMGVAATMPDGVVRPELLVQKADACLYYAKSSGRNQCSIQPE